jgi:uncharacterized protein
MSIGLMLLLMVGPLALALWAQWRVKSTFRQTSQLAAASGFNGAQTAQMIMDAYGVKGVRIEEHQGFLSDHYDPSAKVVRLSPDVFHGTSVAALGIAAHEVGHVIQDATRYTPLVLRNGIVPLASIGSNAGIWMIMGGMVLGAGAGVSGALWLAWAGVALFSLVVLFQLINLPVEFDASRRAKAILQQANLIAPGGEAVAMNRVLNAAAMTYVAATVGAIATLLYYVLILTQNRE